MLRGALEGHGPSGRLALSYWLAGGEPLSVRLRARPEPGARVARSADRMDSRYGLRKTAGSSTNFRVWIRLRLGNWAPPDGNCGTGFFSIPSYSS